MRRATLLVALLAAHASAEPPKGVTEGEVKGSRYALDVPPAWTTADGAKFGVWVTMIPPQHKPGDYVNLWAGARGAHPFLSLILDAGFSSDMIGPLLEKVRGDYGFDAARVWMAGYGEGARTALRFAFENPDALAGIVLIQAMTQMLEAKPSAKATPVLMIADVTCTYARIDETRAFVAKLKDLGYDAAIRELDDPPNHDIWPPAELPKMIDWAEALRPFLIDDLFGAAAEALKADSKAEAWRPRLREEVTRYVRALGDGVSPAAAKAAADGLAGPFRDALQIVRENKPQAKGVALVLGAAKGKKLEGGTLLVCESCDFEQVDDSVIVCTGDVKIGKLHRSVVIAKGAVTIGKEMADVMLFCAGRLKIGTTLDNSTILAVGGAEVAGKAKENWFVNTAEKQIKSNAAERVVKKPKLPGGGR